MVCSVPDAVDSEALEVHRRAQRRLRGLLGRSHIQASAVFYVAPLPLLRKNIGEFHSHYCGTVWLEVVVGGAADSGCQAGSGSLRITEDSHHTLLLVGPQALLNFLLLRRGSQSRRTHPVVKPEAALKSSTVPAKMCNMPPKRMAEPRERLPLDETRHCGVTKDGTVFTPPR